MLTGYLDPASGSAIISAVAAGAAGAGVAAKTMLSKMRLRKRADDADKENGETDVAETAMEDRTP